MEYLTNIRKRKTRGRQEWMARLRFRDEATGQMREKTKSAKSRSEAERKVKSLVDDFVVGGPKLLGTQGMAIGELLNHSLKTRYHEPIYDGEGRIKAGLRS